MGAKCGGTFRDRKVAAPLKQAGLYFRYARKGTFRDRKVAAPLKPKIPTLKKALYEAFRDRKVAAPLKQKQTAALAARFVPSATERSRPH